MTTTKSYLAGLGMTGIVIGSVLVLLAVGTGLVAFDGDARRGRRAGAARARRRRQGCPFGWSGAGAQAPDVAPALATAARCRWHRRR